jgi:DNA-binding response OmpR family regulator
MPETADTLAPPKRVLAIDDEWTHNQLIRAVLSAAGFEALIENDSSKALNRALEEHPDVILLDVNMPEPNGYEVFNMLRLDDRTRHVPVIMVTARAQKSDLDRGQSMGADEYVTKPFDPDELVSAIRKVLAR